MEKFSGDLIKRRRLVMKEAKNQAEEFMVSGGCCPYCGEEDVEEDDFWDREFFELDCLVRCPRCLKSWRAIYGLTEIVTEELSNEYDALCRDFGKGEEEDDDQLGTQTPNH